MQLPQSDELETQYLSRLFDNTSECYKLFWFQSIMTKILEGKNVITYEELIDEMIADAWYMVTEYHLNLGPNDTLEHLVNHIQDISGMKSSEKKKNVIEYITNCDDAKVKEKKRTLTYEVPYRIQSPFLKKNTVDWKKGERIRAEQINNIGQQQRLLYYYSALKGLDTEILIQPDWEHYMIRNQEIIKGWIQFNMINYLQRRNPNVPGISDKLKPPQKRDLKKVTDYWKTIISIEPIHEIYNNEILTNKDISIDHFVPWSYVAHDEFWNLHPTTKNINSSKNNNLPDWDRYFPVLCGLEYHSYEMMNKCDSVRKHFDECVEKHLNSNDIRVKIYRKGLSINEFSNALEDVIQPVYQSAKNCGFRNWIYEVTDKNA